MAISARLLRVSPPAVPGIEVDRLALGATIRVGDEGACEATLFDPAPTSCTIEADAALEIGDIVSIRVAPIGVVDAVVVEHRGDRFECTFLKPLADSDLAALAAADTIVPFPLTAGGEESSMPALERWSRRTRLLVLGGLVTLGWGATWLVASRF